MKKITKIGAMSLGKILGIMYALMGFIFGAIFTLISILGTAIFSSENTGSSLLFGLGAVIFFPILYGVLGFLFGAIAGWIFNLSAKWAGGLEIEFEESSTTEKPAV